MSAILGPEKYIRSRRISLSIATVEAATVANIKLITDGQCLRLQSIDEAF